MVAEDKPMHGHPTTRELHSACHRAFSLSVG